MKRTSLFLILLLVATNECFGQVSLQTITVDDPEKQDTWSLDQLGEVVIHYAPAGLSKGQVVEYFGNAHKAILSAQAQEAGFNKVEAEDLVKKADSERKTLKGGGTEALSNFYATLDFKRVQRKQDLEKRIADMKPDWKSVEAQRAIQAWVEKNMLGGKTLEQVMGKNPQTGKVNTDIVPLLDEAYTSNKNFKELLGCVTELKDIVKKDINQGEEQTKIFEKLLTQVENLTKDVATPLVDQVKDIHANMPKEKDGKLVQAASQKDMDQKADASYVDSEISRIETNVADNIDNLRALALKKDKAFIFVYASYMLKNDEQGFRAWLKPQVKESEFEEKFNDIKAKAEEAKAKKIVKY